MSSLFCALTPLLPMQTFLHFAVFVCRTSRKVECFALMWKIKVFRVVPMIGQHGYVETTNLTVSLIYCLMKKKNTQEYWECHQRADIAKYFLRYLVWNQFSQSESTLYYFTLVSKNGYVLCIHACWTIFNGEKSIFIRFVLGFWKEYFNCFAHHLYNEGRWILFPFRPPVRTLSWQRRILRMDVQLLFIYFDVWE